MRGTAHGDVVTVASAAVAATHDSATAIVGECAPGSRVQEGRCGPRPPPTLYCVVFQSYSTSNIGGAVPQQDIITDEYHYHEVPFIVLPLGGSRATGGGRHREGLRA